MLAIKGLPEGTRASIGELAERLQLQHHSTVELVDRLVKRRLVQRKRAETDRRQVMVSLTPRGEKMLLELSLHHREELLSMGPVLVTALRKLMKTLSASDEAAERAPAKKRKSRAAEGHS
jgi:DNA-binding MarR family transcriptional regulator